MHMTRGRKSREEHLSEVEEVVRRLSATNEVAPDRKEESVQAMLEVIERVQSYLTCGERRGWEVDALCPFHDDHRFGNFQLNLQTGYFFCWACGAQGGVLRLAKHMDVDEETLRILKRVDFDLFAKHLSELLGVRNHEEGLNFILPEKLVNQFVYLPKLYLDRGHSEGLLRALEVSYDHVFNRAVFPVRRITGELVAVQSRAVEKDDPIRWKFYKHELKHLIPEEYAEYLHDYEPPRSAVLFNEHNTLLYITQDQLKLPVTLTEGPGGVMRVLAAGYPCLGTFGTHLAPTQLSRLLHCYRHLTKRRGVAPRIIIAGDGDDPGWKSAVRNAIELGPEFDTRLVNMPDGEDAEDQSPGHLRAMLQSAVPYSQLLEERSDLGQKVRDMTELVMEDKNRKMRYNGPNRRKWTESTDDAARQPADRRLGVERLRRNTRPHDDER